MAIRKTRSAKKGANVISKDDFRLSYNELRPKYERLAVNLQQAIKAFLEESSIPYLDVLFRVKDAESAYEKIGRKDFDKPFEQIEDWCGLRIICYYPSDVDKICEIIKNEFDIISQEDTSKRLGMQEFGYRSTHFILKVKESWMQPPNYRGLGDIKAEVQVRTILMHAWAEVEHKLQYKNADQVPEQFQRKLYLLSAKFEEADGQFEELKDGISRYRAELKENVRGIDEFEKQEFNLDTLQAFLNEAFPERRRDEEHTSDLFSELLSQEISMKELVKSYKMAKDVLTVMEEIWRPSMPNGSSLSQAGMTRAMLDITNPNYRKFRGIEDEGESGWAKGVNEAIKALEKK